MSAPLFDGMICRLPMQPQYLNEHTCKQLNQIFDLMACIEPGEFDENRFIWLEIPRGPIEEFDDFESWKEEGEGETYEEFEKSWLEWYPDETKWYEFMTSTFDGRRFFFLQQKVLIEINKDSIFSRTKETVPEDYLNFIRCLESAVREQTERLRKGQASFNEYISANLPLSKRYGRIQRKVLYEILGDGAVRPDLNLGPDRVERLKELVGKQLAGEWPLVLTEISANDFFRYCELGYDANDYFKGKKPHRSPREKYEAMADGRHGGLLDIDAHSFEAFAQWYHSGKEWQSHCTKTESHFRCIRPMKFFG